MLRITSRSNARYRECIQLRRRRARKQRERFLIDGSRDLDRAISSGIRPTEIFVSENLDIDDATDHSALGRVLTWARAEGCLWQVQHELYLNLCYGDRVSDAVAIAAVQEISLDDIRVPSTPTILILDGIEKPGNIGAIFRTADATGVDAILLTGASTDPLNPNAIRASAGTVFTVANVRCTQEAAVQWLHHHQIPLALARVDGELSHWDLPLQGAIALAFGNEATGLAEQWDHEAKLSFRIPMDGIVDSLNVSVSTAIVLFEAKRQRRPTCN